MHQQSLLDDVPSEPGRGMVGIAGSAPTLTATQKKFNLLIERLTAQRRELEIWRAFGKIHHQLLADRYHPMVARLRQKQIAMVRLLDEILDGKALGKRERAKTRDILSQLLTPLLADSPDPELVELHDKHAERSFGATRQEHLDAMRALASEAFGVDVESYPGGESPEELADWLDEQVRAGRPGARRPPPRKKSAKTLAREALREQAAAGGTRAVREVFRKLVSELHPDREADPAEQARKTELMQRVNQAYKAGDLLALLELQLGIEQIDPRALAGLAEDRLRHYIHVLEEQSRRLREELSDLLSPYATAMGGSPVRNLSPALVQRALEAEIGEIRGLVRRLEGDLVRFQDVAAFKRSLRDYAIDPVDDPDLPMPPEFRRRRRRR